MKCCCMCSTPIRASCLCWTNSYKCWDGSVSAMIHPSVPVSPQRWSPIHILMTHIHFLQRFRADWRSQEKHWCVLFFIMLAACLSAEGALFFSGNHSINTWLHSIPRGGHWKKTVSLLIRPNGDWSRVLHIPLVPWIIQQCCMDSYSSHYVTTCQLFRSLSKLWTHSLHFLT